MPCHAMHPMQDLFLESFSYVLQFDMHSYVDKNCILVQSGCYIPLTLIRSITAPGCPGILRATPLGLRRYPF
jgi:hypothetical protein